MEFTQVIEERRSTRKFSKRIVSKKKIIRLIECARMSPSAANRQPWHFVILENEQKEKVASIMEERMKKNKVELDSANYATHTYQAVNSVINSIRVIREAPILILVFRPNSDDFRDADYLSIGSAVEHICLKATDLNLGSLWIRDIIYTKQEIARLFTDPSMELVVSVAIGYSSEFPYPRMKKKLEEIMEWKSI